MAVPNSLFAILADQDGVSFAPRKILQGDSVASKEGLLAFAFKDSSGNAIIPALNSEGALPVSFDAGTTLREFGTLASGSQTTNVEAQVVEIDLTADTVYTAMSFFASGTRLASLRIAYVDDAGGTPVITTLGHAILSSADNNIKWNLELDILDTTGGTGDQKLRVYATPLENQKSDINVAVSVNEVAA